MACGGGRRHHGDLRAAQGTYGGCRPARLSEPARLHPQGGCRRRHSGLVRHRRLPDRPVRLDGNQQLGWLREPELHPDPGPPESPGRRLSGDGSMGAGESFRSLGLRGEGAPLHYLGDDIIRDNNREVICPDSWAHDPEIDADLVPYDAQDSCDEFPFARTYESGAMADNVNGDPKPYVTTGDDCAQVTAKQTGFTNNPDNLAADWPTITVDGTPTLSEPCVRGHIPKRLNSSVGGSYSSFVRARRLVDKDSFWLSVTSGTS